MTLSHNQYTFDRVVRILGSIAIIIALLWIVNLLKGVLLPFCVACLIAYLFEPVVQYNKSALRFHKRGPAIAVSLFESVFIFSLLCYFLVPLLVDEFVEMAGVLKHYAESEIDIPYIPKQVHVFFKRNINFAAISRTLTAEQITTFVENTLNTAWTIISGSVTMLFTLVSWMIVAIYVIFIMIDYDRLGRGLKSMVPPRYRHVAFHIAADVKESMNHYFRGQALIAAIVGVLFAIGFSIIGLPMAVVFGLFVGLLNLVPYLQLVSFVPALFLCLIYTASGAGGFWQITGECALVYIIVQVIQDMYLTPRIMGKVMGLNPALILLSLSVWGSLMGFIGLIVALPLTTLIISYYEQYIIRRDRSLREPARKIRRDIDDINDAVDE